MDKLTFDCPTCGAPRRLEGQGAGRVLRCRSWGCKQSPERIPDDDLTIKQIAEGMALESYYGKSDAKRKEQAKARRAASTVQGFAGSPYLSTSEAETLRAAVAILERIGTAAELAKKVLKRKEEAEALRLAGRKNMARDILLPRLKLPDSIPEALPLVLAMTTADPSASRSPLNIETAIIDSLARVDRRLTIKTVEGDIRWELVYAWEYLRDCIVSHIAFSETPDAATMARQYIEEVEKALSSPELAAQVAELMGQITPKLVQERLEKANPNAGKTEKGGGAL